MGVVKKKLRIFPLIEPDLTIPVDKNTNSKKSPLCGS